MRNSVPNRIAGHVYILVNASLHKQLKIGMTTRTPDERARELSQATAVPSPFMVAYAEEVPDARAAESMIHERLARFRVRKGREFFNLPLCDAIHEVTQIASELRQTLTPQMLPEPLFGRTPAGRYRCRTCRPS